MIEADTVRLLRECDAGVKMGVSSIDDVLEYVKAEPLRKALMDCKKEHEGLQSQIDEKLQSCRDEGKEPNPMAKGMSWIKTNMKLMLEESDRTVAGLITDGCDMGVKSLSRYLNQYAAADEASKNICKRLIQSEEELGKKLRAYL